VTRSRPFRKSQFPAQASSRPRMLHKNLTSVPERLFSILKSHLEAPRCRDQSLTAGRQITNGGLHFMLVAYLVEERCPCVIAIFARRRQTLDSQTKKAGFFQNAQCGTEKIRIAGLFHRYVEEGFFLHIEDVMNPTDLPVSKAVRVDTAFSKFALLHQPQVALHHHERRLQPVFDLLNFRFCVLVPSLDPWTSNCNPGNKGCRNNLSPASPVDTRKPSVPTAPVSPAKRIFHVHPRSSPLGKHALPVCTSPSLEESA